VVCFIITGVRTRPWASKRGTMARWNLLEVLTKRDNHTYRDFEGLAELPSSELRNWLECIGTTYGIVPEKADLPTEFEFYCAYRDIVLNLLYDYKSEEGFVSESSVWAICYAVEQLMTTAEWTKTDGKF